MARADARWPALRAHLRATLAAPALDFAEPPVPLTGGFDTEILTFTLREAPPAWSVPLVLRILRPHHDPMLARREQAVQNTAAEAGYPAPRVVLAMPETGVLGAPFLVMQRLPGRPLIEVSPLGMDRVLVDIQTRLHALDPAPLRHALGEAITFERYLDTMERRIVAGALTGLAPALRWLRSRPPRETAPVICHGDLHPRNVLVQDGTVSGVLDWPNALIADAAFDVASTHLILRFVPPGLATRPPLSWLAHLGQPILARRYLAGYRRQRPIESARLAYFEVAAALRALVRTGASRRRTTGGPPPDALDRSSYGEHLAAHASRICGVDVTLPPV
jgi:aminoglycoside phosphotransferase (APT) family kinase protein